MEISLHPNLTLQTIQLVGYGDFNLQFQKREYLSTSVTVYSIEHSLKKFMKTYHVSSLIQLFLDRVCVNEVDLAG